MSNGQERRRDKFLCRRRKIGKTSLIETGSESTLQSIIEHVQKSILKKKIKKKIDMRVLKEKAYE